MSDVRRWLGARGLGELADTLAAHDVVDLNILRELTEDDLRELGLTLGHRKRLLRALAEPAEATPVAAAPVATRERAGADAERRQTTILFADLVGSTALATRLDPEDMFAVIGAYRRACAEVVGDFGGHVGAHLGDGLLAYFGFPSAREDDAERAVRAGLELVAAVRRLRLRQAPELHARVGIDTGLVVIGELLGRGTGEQEAVVGDTPNLAARLQQAAPPDGVVISDHTRRLLGALFACADLGPQALKGFDAPVRAWRVTGEGRAESRFEARRGGAPLPPLIGREHELRLLVQRWEMARGGEGQVVLLSGEGGIGKSRLVEALCRHVGEEEPRGAAVRLRYFCSQFYAGTSLHPVIERIRRAAGLRRDEPPEAQLDKLEALLRRHGQDVARGGPLFATLCSLPAGGRYPEVPRSPQERKAATFQLLLAELGTLCRERPAIVLFEDAHWIDAATGELLALLVDAVRALPALLVVTCRPEYAPPWRMPPHATALRLNRFGRQQAAGLVGQLTGGKALPEAVRELILRRADGVPLYVEELTKAILEWGALAEEGDAYRLVGELPTIRIPATLHDSLMARLDRLGGAKEVALWASALGRSFGRELLHAVAPIAPAEIDQGLERLVDAEMVYRHGLQAEDAYEFKHALVHEAAYGSMLRDRRHAMHARIAGVLEERFPETAQAQPEILAHHLEQAALPARAFDHAVRAGDQAAGRYASPEARLRYDTALRLARELPASPEAQRREIRAVLKRASVAIGEAQVEEDLGELRHARGLAERLGHRPRQAQAHYWAGRLHYVAGRFDRAVEHARASLGIADELGDERLAAAPVNLLARTHCLRGEPALATAFAERSAAQMRGLGDGIEEASITGVLAFALGLHGRFDEAYEAAARGVALAERLEHVPTRAACHHFVGVVHGWRGDLATAHTAFDAALELAAASGDVFRRYLALGWRGEALLHGGEPALAEADLAACLDLARRLGAAYHAAAFRAFAAEAQLRLGRLEHARPASEAALEQAEQAGQPWGRSIALRARAEVLAADGLPAEDLAREALAIQDGLELRPDAARSRLALGRVLAAAGDAAGAEAEAAAARTALAAMRIATDPGSRGGR